MLLEIVKFIFYSLLLVVISKYILVNLLRKLAETLNLKPKTIGTIAGTATSVPELLTVSFSAASGLMGTSAYNILSSNVINFFLYLLSIFANKNRKGLSNRAIRIDLGMVLFTIFIPMGMLVFQMEGEMALVPIFLLLFIFFYFIDYNAHKLYLKKEEEEIGEEIKEETRWLKGKKRKTLGFAVMLILTGLLLFFVGNILADVLENLCFYFHVPEFMIGILLGLITSIPELITFFESQKYHAKENREDLGIIEATNNLLSSNVLNLFIIQSIGVLLFQIIGK